MGDMIVEGETQANFAAVPVHLQSVVYFLNSNYESQPEEYIIKLLFEIMNAYILNNKNFTMQDLNGDEIGLIQKFVNEYNANSENDRKINIGLFYEKLTGKTFTPDRIKVFESIISSFLKDIN